MTGRDTKVQLGVRVPANVREMAVAAAERRQVSLNLYIEGLIIGAGRTAEGEQVVLPTPDAAPPEPEGQWRPFDANCRNGAYHWLSRPGNPCKFCGGEI